MMFSIIIPIYNSVKYLEICIETVIIQTYKNIEIILVDDGSSEICDKYAQSDARIKVIHKDNGGQTSARIAGLKMALGEYIGFVDSDDWVEPDYFNQLLEIQKKTNADMVCGGYHNDIGQDSELIFNNIPDGIYCFDDIRDNFIYSGKFFEYGILPHMVLKVFKKELIYSNQMSVPLDIRAGEDAAVTYSCLCNVNKVAVCHVKGYHYVQHPQSMTKSYVYDEDRRINCLVDFLKGVFKQRNIGGSYLSQLRVYRNYMLALDQGLPVENPEVFFSVKQDYDYILIANITESIAESIRDYLIGKGVPTDKIRWFTEEFIGR